MMLPKGFIFGLMNLCLMTRCTGGNERCVASIRGACPPDWSQWGGKCYTKLPANLPWAEAKEECIKMGSVLVMPQSQEETEFLLQNLHHYFWINCNNCQIEDSREYQDGPNDECRNRKQGQPSNFHDQDCTLLQTSGDWNDVPCQENHAAVCQRPAPVIDF